LAVQGGLLASAIGDARETGEKKQVFPIALFLITKVMAYTLLGFLLGLLGERISFSISARALFVGAAGLFMIGTGLHFLKVHPIFRYFVLRLPRRLERLAHKSSNLEHSFAPAVLGLATVFLPCGVTQAMMVASASSASPFLGSGILFFYTLGTMPIFFVMGYLSSVLSGRTQYIFNKVVGLLVLALGVYSLYTASVLLDLRSSDAKIENFSSVSSANPTVEIIPEGYSPSRLVLPANTDITLTLENKNSYSCAQSFLVPKFGLEAFVPPGSREVLSFNSGPAGVINFSCSMGMYRGQFIVK